VFSIRIHGRGGQGAVTAAEVLSVAAFDDGLHAQAFPTFGSERTGAPVVAFCRIDEVPIRIHEPIADPDAVLIADPTLLHQVKVFEGVGPDAYVLVNTSRPLDGLGIGSLVDRLRPGRVASLPATEIAREHLGRPLPNLPLLGGFAALTGAVSIESVVGAIEKRFTGRTASGNVAAARYGYEFVLHGKRSLADA
jgi:pyruvate ferredoxin oxidoreductase gamma subunit